jgi:hypothetical protein
MRLVPLTGLFLKRINSYGGLPRRGANPGPEGGRPSVEYWLNEGRGCDAAAEGLIEFRRRR